jgi:hypothetical protein
MREQTPLGSNVMLDYSHVSIDYEPYPIGLTRPAFQPEVYQELVRTFPPIELFKYKKSKGEKYSLSQVNNSKNYHQYVKQSEPWRRFHDFIHSDHFIRDVYDLLRSHHVDLGPCSTDLKARIHQRASAWKKGLPQPHFPRLKARFEFSAMPITGGNILPHTDSPGKSVTMVVPMLGDDEWDERWGGGTSIVRPRDPSRLFNRANAYLDFEDVENVKTFPFLPNQCLIFVKTYNSWHAVWPMQGSERSTLRKTLTINIDKS